MDSNKIVEIKKPVEEGIGKFIGNEEMAEGGKVTRQSALQPLEDVGKTIKISLNNRLKYLYQKRNQVKKKRNRGFRQFYRYSILPWKIWGVTIVALIFISLVFRLSWKEEIFPFLGLLSFHLLIAFVWGIYWMFKIKKCSQKLDKIDEKISKSNF